MRTEPFIAMATLFAATSCGSRQNNLSYPAAPCDSTTYEVFGIKVNDIYRPLENDTAEATLEWVKAENAITRNYLDKIPFRDKIHKRLDVLNRIHKSGMPYKENDGKYYYFENDGKHNQSILYRMDSLDSEPEVFIDPNKLSEDGTVALTGVFQSTDGKYTAYTISRSGSDWTEIYVLDTATGTQLDDHIEWAKFTDAAWLDDGFFYSAYQAPEAGKEFSNANENHNIYYHKIGTPQSEDVLAFSDAGHPLHFHQAVVGEDGSGIAIIGAGEGIGESVMFSKLGKSSKDWKTVVASQDYSNSVIDIADGKIYMLTSVDAGRNRFVEVDGNNPDKKNWKTIIPEDPDGGVLTSVQFAGPDHLIAVFDKDASNHAYLYSKEGEMIREIEFPTYGTASFSSGKKSDEIFYSFSSFVYPSTIYKYNIADNSSEQYKATTVDGLNPEDYITEQIFYKSADGTEVPMFIVRKKDLKADKSNPVYLYGYGGFNITLNPSFSANRLFWLENNGIYVQTNLRGGGEYGETWHLAGTKMNKENVFNDFIAAAEYMIDNGWTTPDLLTIEGGSNGGLLVGATVNKRPDLFKVAIPRVGVMDMMRYHLFTIGWNWAADYGTADDSKEMAEYLLAYSPIHNIKNDGTPYPAILVTTADHDDRVVPAHSFKSAATLQAADTGDAPKLIRIDSKAGHGSGKPVGKVVDEYTDIYSFIYKNLGITPDIK